ncbi:MAG: HepT-like ribonuclease domain-containing protein [Reyranella sp.]
MKTPTIPASSIPDIRRRVEETRALMIQGQPRAAFVMAWSLLEAALHRIDSEKGARPRTPGTVVETLAMLGRIDPTLERRVRPLIELRNRVVHGDLQVEPSADDVRSVLSAVEQSLASEAG